MACHLLHTKPHRLGEVQDDVGEQQRVVYNNNSVANASMIVVNVDVFSCHVHNVRNYRSRSFVVKVSS